MSRAGPNAEVAESIQELTKANQKLERMLAKIGTKADTPDFRDRMHAEQTGSTQLVKRIMGQFAQIRTAQMRDEEAGWSSANGSAVIARLSKSFDREFHRFQNINAELDRKQVRVIQTLRNKQRAESIEGDNTTRRGYEERDPLNRTRQHMYADGGYDQLQDQDQMQAQELDIQFIEYDVEEMEKRSREIQGIESDVLEVSEMYKDLQNMVHEQQEHIDTIDSNILQARDKTEQAHQELLTAEEYQKKARKKKCCVLFLVTLIIAIIVVMIMVFNK